MIEFFDMRAELAPQREALEAAVARVVASGAFVLGEEVAAFERELKEALGSLASAGGEGSAAQDPVQVIGVSSGTDALLCALLAHDVGPGDEVITTPLSFVASASAIARLGAVPVFAEIDPVTLLLDPSAALARVTARTKAVVAVHLFGARCDGSAWAELAARVPIIEDAAQRIGSPVFGHIATLSFFPTKHLGAAGDGGAVVCGGAGGLARAARVRRLRQHGFASKHRSEELGGNFRLDAIQAAFLRVRLLDLAEAIVRRRRAAARYHALLAARGRPELIAQPPVEAHRYQQFVIRVQGREEARDQAPGGACERERERVRATLAEAGVPTAIYYPTPLHLQPCFSALGYRKGAFPHAERACAELLALPFYPQISADTQAHVIRALDAALGSA